MAESSVSKSVSSVSQSVQQFSEIAQGKSTILDSVFPLLDQMMQRTKLPGWFLAIVSVFILCQVLSVGFWIYTPIYSRTSGTWEKLYDVIITIFYFQDPLDVSGFNLEIMGVCIGLAAVSLAWIAFMVWYNNTFYSIPTPYLYISSLIIDVLDPLFITPSVYVANHGIIGLHSRYDALFIVELVIGMIAYIAFLGIFLLNTFLKSRSVVLTNLLFPMFDHFSVTTWVTLTSGCSILSAVFIFFDNWFYAIGGVCHVLITLYICYRLTFIPFYEVWRNSICLAFGFTTLCLDVNYFVLYAVPSLSYNYTIFIFVGGLLIGYIFSVIFYTKRVAVIKKRLTYQAEVTDANEYFDQLKINRNSTYAMMYIVVGLARLGDYFIDGSLTDYIVNCGNLESAVSILLQVVTFFPSESRKMDVLFKKVLMKRKLSITDRFLVYQVYRIKTRRLVSDTKDTLETFNKLKAKNDGCKAIIRNFWDKQDANNGFLTSLSLMVNDIDSLFKASLANNPNNLRLTNEYSNFLAECKCDFDGAVKESIRAESIGDGKNFNVDVSFRSVVNRFPRYLKDKILDVKGHRILKANGKQSNAGSESKNGSSHSSNSNSKSTFDSQSVDIERQELVCKKILRDSKVRLAFHHSIMDLIPGQATAISISIVWDAIVILAFYFGFYGYLRSELYWRRSSYRDLSNAGYSTFYAVYANVYTITKFAADNNRFNTSDALLGDISIDEGHVVTLLPTEYSLQRKAFYCMNQSNVFLNNLLNSLADQSLAGDDPFEIASILLQVASIFHVCVNATPTNEIKASLKAQLITMNYHTNFLAGSFNVGVKIPNIYQNNDYCQILSNIPLIAENAETTFKSILDFNIQKADSYKNKFIIWTAVGAGLILISISILGTTIINTYNKLADKIIKALISLPNNVKEEAKKPLMINSDDQDLPSHTKLEPSHAMDIMVIVFFFVLFLVTGIYICFGVLTIKANNNLTKILKWFYYSCRRITMASQIGNNALQLIFLNGSLPQQIVNIDELRQREVEVLDELLEAQKILVYGNDDVPGSLGYDATLDHMNVENYCDLNHDPHSVHDMYACGSLDVQIQMFKQMVQQVLRNPESFGGGMLNEVASNMAHILRFHFYPSVIRCTQRISDIMEIAYDNWMRNNIIFLIIAIVCTIIIFTLPLFFRAFLINNYRMLLMLIQHLPPQTIIDTPEILELFTGKKKIKDEKMSISKSIVYDASECIIITNSNSVIEIINQSVTENIGLTPDQMLGQQIANFFSDKDQARLISQIELMTSGQGSAFWQDHLEMTNDGNESVPFSVTMIGMKDNDSNEINSIVFILANETEEIEKRKAAEEAKAKSEKLLYQILPKDIVVRLNRGETDISFTIPSATIFFIDIVKFSAYAAMLTPSEIMTNLSLVFATFDKIVAEYPSITKIKLIGDVYMAAAGLFQGEDDPSTKHAEDAVRCCLACSKAMEEINMKLNASLEVRIGVNSGGPLIGGVLGTDKPTFDIIGDTINVAARLQSTDIPGNVQISATTKSMIENLDFSIEERGEIYLKGKGNQLTYFVSLSQKPDPENSFALSLQAHHDN